MTMLLQWFVTSSVLILAVLLLRRLLGGRISPRVKYALWAVVLVRLLLPLSPLPSLFSLTAALEPVEQKLDQRMDSQMVYAIPTQVYPTSPGTVESGEEPIIDRTEHSWAGGPTYYSGGVVIDEESATHYYFMMPLDELCVLLWGAGGLALGLVLLASNLHLSHKLRDKRLPLECSGCPLPVYTVEGLSSPCLFGLFRPSIYLTPDLAADSPARVHVLAHELTHFRQKDHLWSALRCVALALHWYNPLVWLAVALSKRDGELSCDAGAVKALGEAERIPYGRTLVSLVARRSLRPGDLLSCSTSMAEGKGSIQERITQLVKHPETRKTALFAVVALAALAVVFTFGNSQRQQTDSTGSLYSSLRSQIQAAQSIRYTPSPTSSTAYPDPITDADLLEEAKELLMGAYDLMTPVTGTNWTVESFTAASVTLITGSEEVSYYICPFEGRDYLITPAQLNAEEYTPVAVFSQDTGAVEAALDTLAQQQQNRNIGTWRVDYPEYKNQLTQLFLDLEEPAFLEQNVSASKQEWLTEHTAYYEVTYGSPWWLNNAPEGWYARAMNGSEWYTIVISDSIASQVQAICQEQARYPSWDTVTSVLANASTIQYAPMSAMDYRSNITDPDTVSQLSQALEQGLSTLPDDWVPQRVAAEDLPVFTFVTDDSRTVTFYLEEAETSYLLACGCTVGTWETEFPVLAQVSKDAVAQADQIIAAWQESQSGSASYPADVDTLRTMANLQAEDIQGLSLGKIRQPENPNWANDVDKEQLAQLIRYAALAFHAPSQGTNPSLEYSLWSLDVALSSGQTLTLTAGQAADQISISDSLHLSNCPELYQLIRQLVDNTQTLTVDASAVLQTMEQVLAQEEQAVWSASSNGPEVYLGAQLTSLNRLASFDNLVDGSTVNIYGYDFGFVMDDLSHVPWTDGTWIDGQLRCHTGIGYRHLITVEQNENVVQYVTVTTDFPLDPESYGAHTDSQLSLGEYAALTLGLRG